MPKKRTLGRRSAHGRWRPATRRNIQALIRRLARENPERVYLRIHGELAGRESRSPLPPSRRSSRPAASTPPRGGPGGPGHVPALPGRGHPGLRLLHRRPARRHPGLRPDRNRARHPARRHPRSHPASHRRMDRPAGPQPPHGPRRPNAPGQVHDPRPGARTSPPRSMPSSPTPGSGPCSAASRRPG